MKSNHLTAAPKVPDEIRWRDLMVSAQDGEQEAYERLLQELAPCLKAYCKKYLWNSNTVDDCVQECLFAIHKARHTYDPSRNFPAWLFTIAKHKVIDQLRGRRVREGRETTDSQQVALAQDLRPHPFHAHEEQQELIELLSRLKPDYREALQLTKLQDMPVREAAHRLGISESTLKTRVHRAISSLKKEIQKDSSQ